MKITLIFPSRESEDLSFGACFIASFAWLQGNKIVKEYPHSPKYPEGALGDLISELKLKQKIPSDQSDLVIVKHPNGHGDEDDFKAISTEAESLGFNIREVITRISEVYKTSDDSDKKAAELFASEFRELVYTYNHRNALCGKDRKFTQSRLARELRLSESAFSKLLSGNNMPMPSRKVMKKITDFFGSEINNKDLKALIRDKTKERHYLIDEIEKLKAEKMYLTQVHADLDKKAANAVRPENNEKELRKCMEQLVEVEYKLLDRNEMLATLTELHEVEEKQLIISEKYSNGMKKSLDKLKNIYPGGI